MTMSRTLTLSAIAFVSVVTPSLASGAAGGDQPSLLQPDLGSVVWSIVLFVLLLVVLGKFVWPQILKGLQDRETKIREDLEQAQQANAQAQAALGEYEQKLAEARAESRQLLDQARADAEELRGKLTGQTEQEIARLRQQATDQIRLAKQQAVQDLYAKAADLTTDIAAKVLQREINEDDARRLVEQSMQQLDKMN